MALNTSAIPQSKKFFKISELAGGRWPNVTEDQIYEWHDVNFTLPFSFLEDFIDAIKEVWPCGGKPPSFVIDAVELCWSDPGQVSSMIETIKGLWPYDRMPDSVMELIRKSWLENHPSEDNLACALKEFLSDNTGGLTNDHNLLAYWVFLPDFRSLRLKDKETNETAGEGNSSFDDLMRRARKIVPYDLLSPSFFRPTAHEVKGFAFNKEGKADCSCLFDEEGEPRIPAVFDQETQRCHAGTVEIKKDDLLIMASSVRLMEKLAPEITSKNFRREDEVFNPADSEKSKDMLQNPPGSKILASWKEIANYIGCSESTAKRRYKKVIRHTPTGTVMTTTSEIDNFRISTAARVKKK